MFSLTADKPETVEPFEVNVLCIIAEIQLALCGEKRYPSDYTTYGASHSVK